MSPALKALSALLSYPEEALLAALDEVGACAPREAAPLVEALRRADPYEAQERYVALFDRSRALSLHLFEHVHGESRERGQAMVDLQALYAAHGLALGANELPDFIPAFLEFVSRVDDEEGKGLLRETAHIFRALGDRLAERGSPYAHAFAALLRLAGEKGLTRRLAPAPAPEAENRLALDAEWRDPEVSFGGRPEEAQPVRFYRKGVPA